MHGLEPGQVIDCWVYNDPLRSWVRRQFRNLRKDILGRRACCAVFSKLECLGNELGWSDTHTLRTSSLWICLGCFAFIWRVLGERERRERSKYKNRFHVIKPRSSTITTTSDDVNDLFLGSRESPLPIFQSEKQYNSNYNFDIVGSDSPPTIPSANNCRTRAASYPYSCNTSAVWVPGLITMSFDTGCFSAFCTGSETCGCVTGILDVCFPASLGMRTGTAQASVPSNVENTWNKIMDFIGYMWKITHHGRRQPKNLVNASRSPLSSIPIVWAILLVGTEWKRKASSHMQDQSSGARCS